MAPAEGFGRLVRELPVAVEAPGRVRKDFSHMTLRHLVAALIEQPGRVAADELPADRAQLRQLLLGAQQGRSPLLGRAVHFKELRVAKPLEDGELGVLARRRRRYEQPAQAADVAGRVPRPSGPAS